MPTTPRDPAVPAWKQHLEANMTFAARELMGPGYTPSYYQQIAADFMPAAEGAVAEACANAAEVAIATFREALAQSFERDAENPSAGSGARLVARALAQTVRDFKMEG